MSLPRLPWEVPTSSCHGKVLYDHHSKVVVSPAGGVDNVEIKVKDESGNTAKVCIRGEDLIFAIRKSLGQV